MSRSFSGTNNFISGSIGDAALTGALTIAVLVRRGVNGALHCLWNANDSLNGPKVSLYLQNDNTIQLNIDGATSVSAMTVLTAEGWCLVAATKPSGSSVARLHKYVYGTDAWTHQNGTGSVGNTAATNTGWQIGKYSTIGYLNGDVELVGAWKREMGDAELETLPFSLQAWYSAAPNALWLLDQSLTTQNVVDLAGGGASQTGITGTAIATSQLPVFNRYGELFYARGPVVVTGFQPAWALGANRLISGGVQAGG